MFISNSEIIKITNCLESEKYLDIKYNLAAIKNMLNIINFKYDEAHFNYELYKLIRTWPNLIIQIHKNKTWTTRCHLMALTDALTVAFSFLKKHEIIKVIIDAEKLEIKEFVTTYIAAFVPIFLKENILMDEVLKPLVPNLVRDVLNHCSKISCNMETCQDVGRLIETVSFFLLPSVFFQTTILKSQSQLYRKV